MSELGQKRRFGDISVTSILPLKADIRRMVRHGRPDQKGSTGRDNRMFVEGVLWIVRTGSPWRDLPEAFGDWNSVFRRFSRWSLKGVWWRIFEAMSDDPDFE